jgi:hypothetical protein
MIVNRRNLRKSYNISFAGCGYEICSDAAGASTMKNSALRRRLLAAAFGGIVLWGVPPSTALAHDDSLAYPWCASGADGNVDCSYTTFAQCQASASGTGGCFHNPHAGLR